MFKDGSSSDDKTSPAGSLRNIAGRETTEKPFDPVEASRRRVADRASTFEASRAGCSAETDTEVAAFGDDVDVTENWAETESKGRPSRVCVLRRVQGERAVDAQKHPRLKKL